MTNKEIISSNLDEYNKLVSEEVINHKIPQFPKVYMSYNEETNRCGFFVSERDEEKQEYRTRLIFLAQNDKEAISFIRGLLVAISYLPIKI
ncbi:MAG: hypothetical protein PHE32_04150 [Candidatus Shapirobacteria bacterium]|nr:hypothetical protein [Candidatus Shapirobacteria bacterium]